MGADDCILRIFDLRNTTTPCRCYCPASMVKSIFSNLALSRYSKAAGASHITGASYSRDGGTIAATYNDDNIYLFSTEEDTPLDSIWTQAGDGEDRPDGVQT